jgi:hypothetical protein
MPHAVPAARLPKPHGPSKRGCREGHASDGATNNGKDEAQGTGTARQAGGKQPLASWA